jgi:excisionase family DNA binding protein
MTPRPHLAPLDLAQRYTVTEACMYLRCSRARVYALVRRGELVTLTDGRRRYVPGTAIAARSRAPAERVAP